MKSMILRTIILSLLALLVLSSCTRNTPNNDAQFVLDLGGLTSQQKSSAQSTGQIEFIVINVRGPGISSPFTYQWDAWEHCTQPCDDDQLPAFPGQIEISVPSGNDRLIQVLAVKMSTVDESLEFIYGDKTTVLVGGSQTVDISMSSIGSSSGGEGRITGRYKSTKGFISSDVIIKYQPSLAGRPAMEIEREEMFAGWFSVFGLTDVSFKYELAATGETMWEAPVNLTTFSSANSVLKIDKPITYADFDNDNVADESSQSGRIVVGFWEQGVASTTQHVCYDSTTQDSSEWYTDEALLDPLTWISDFTLSGGLAACSGAAFTDYIEVPSEMILNHGGHIVSLLGPFKTFETAANPYPSLIHTSYDESNQELIIDWKYLPGVISSTGISGATAFVNRNITDEENFYDFGGVDCESLSSKGFNESYDVTGTTSTVTLTNMAAADLNNTKVVICPFQGDHYFRTVIESHCLGQCGGGSQPATISSVSPLSAADIGLTEMTITGSSLLGAMAVRIGGLACTISTITDTAITCLSPAIAVGTYNLTIEFSSETITATDQITVNNAVFTDHVRAHVEEQVFNNNLTSNAIQLESTGVSMLIGKTLYYQTNAGLLGVLEVENYDTSGGLLTFGYRTFYGDGTVADWVNSATVNGTWSFNLDVSDNAVDDFQNQQINGTEATITPWNGALFYLLP